MFQRDFTKEEGFFKYNPAYEQEQKARRVAYMMQIQSFQAINPNKGECVSIEAPMYTDKKFAQPGAG